MKLKIKNRLLQGNEVAACVQASSDGLRAWVAIYPLTLREAKDSFRLRDELPAECAELDKFVYRIYQFELPSEYIENDWDVSEEEMVNRQGTIVCSLEDVERILGERHISSDDLTEPWKTDYPL